MHLGQACFIRDVCFHVRVRIQELMHRKGRLQTSAKEEILNMWHRLMILGTITLLCS
jgi:hypothetical protein